MGRLWVAMITIGNFMGIKFAEIPVKGRMTILTGKADAGKSSVIQALWTLFLGKVAEPDMPVRRGAAGMEIMVTITGDQKFVASRTDKSPLNIKMAPGCTAWGKPQQMLDSITNAFMQNPIEFVRLGRRESRAEEKREQVRQFLNALKLDFDPDEVARENAQSYKKRTELGRDVNKLNAEMALIAVQDGLPAERPDLDAIRARIREVSDYNRTIVAQMTERQNLINALAAAEGNEQRNTEYIGKAGAAIEAMVAEIQQFTPAIQLAGDIRDGLSELREKADRLPELKGDRGARPVDLVKDAHFRLSRYVTSAEEALGGLKGTLEAERRALKAAERQQRPLEEAVAEARMLLEQTPVPVEKDTMALAAELDQANIIHREMDRKERRDALYSQKEQLDAEIRGLKRGEDERNERSRAALANAKMPLEGLSFDEAGGRILFDSGDGPVPLAQHGEATQLKVSIAIGLAAEPRLRLVMIPNGEAFNDERLEDLEQMAEEMDFQVIMAKAGEPGGEWGISMEEVVMEKGEVKAITENVSKSRKRRNLPSEDAENQS